jgi:hypothetical protein
MALPGSPAGCRFVADLPDPRRETKNQLPLLLAILVIALCAIIAGWEAALERAA